MKRKVVFIGAGGFAKSAIDSLDKDKYEIYGFIDSFKLVGSEHLGFPILAATIDDFKDRDSFCYFVSIGDNKNRTEKYLKLLDYKCKVISIIDKTALISENSKLGNGVFIGKMAIINSHSEIGDNVIINTKALIEHGCTISSNTNISTNTALNGDVIVKSFSFIGSSAVINGQLTIGEYSIVGSGAVVIRNVDPYCVVAGVPAKFIKNSNLINM